MAVIDKNYHNLLDKILQEGYTYEDPNRKGVNRLEILSYTFRHEFKDGFPAITTKKLNYKSVVTELIWFLRGDTNIKYLVDNGCNIWNKDAYNYAKKECNYNRTIEEFINDVKKQNKFQSYTFKLGNCGRIYGAQWRNWNNIGYPQFDDLCPISHLDQISNLIKGLKETPMGTKHIVTAWNPAELDDMALPPCHHGFQVVVRPLYISDFKKLGLSNLDSKNLPKYGFELHWHQRSVDTFLGLPFNITSYATLALILEKITGYKALAIQGDLKKVHLYDNSLDAVKEQLSRDVDKYGKSELEFQHDFQRNLDVYNKDLILNDFIATLEFEDFKLENYKSYPHIKVEMLERDE